MKRIREKGKIKEREREKIEGRKASKRKQWKLAEANKKDDVHKVKMKTLRMRKFVSDGERLE